MPLTTKNFILKNLYTKPNGGVRNITNPVPITGINAMKLGKGAAGDINPMEKIIIINPNAANASNKWWLNLSNNAFLGNNANIEPKRISQALVGSK